MKFKDQVAVITGGGRALGKATAIRLAREGAALVIAGPVQEELDQTVTQLLTLGTQAVAALVDVAQEDQVQCMAQTARQHFGRIDLLVNNAGIIGPTARVQDMDRADWDETMAVNLTGPMLAAKAVLPDMIAQRSGNIINISSIGGKMGYALRSPYGASKAALISLTWSLAREVGEHGIRVNAICPGPIEGERMHTLIQSRAAALNQTADEVRQTFYIEPAPLKRMVENEEVADMVAFLASPEAAAITGQAIDVSCGYGV